MSETFHIIGAGISGLTLALELLKKEKNVRIYEKLKYVGGLTRTEKINGTNFDCGPHLFHTNNKEIKDYWMNLLGNEISEPKLYGANYKSGKIYEYPISVQSLKTQYSSNEKNIILGQLKNIKSQNKLSAKNYSEYVNNIAGEFLTEIFFTKYPEKLWGIQPKNLSARFAPRRVEIRDKKRPFHSGKGKWAGVLKNGCGALAQALEKKINEHGVYIEYNSNLTAYLFKDNSVKNNYKQIDTIKFAEKSVNLQGNDFVISTMPITSLAKILKIKNKLWNRSLKIVCLLVDEKIDLDEKYDWIYYDSKEIIFHRVTNQNSFSVSGLKKNQTILSCEIAYNENDKIDKKSDKIIIDQCIKDLKSVGVIKKEKVVQKHLIDAKAVYPGINVGYEEELGRVKGLLSFVDNLYTHGALAEYEYADTQVLTAKSIDLANELTKQVKLGKNPLKKLNKVIPEKSFFIDNTKVGINEKCYIIAEIGLNHNGDVELCKKLIDQAKLSGANAVKLQSYNLGRVSKKARTSRYYEDLVDTQDSLSDIVDSAQLNFSNTRKIFNYAKSKKITIFSTPFDLDSLKNLEKLNCPAYKISSMDVVNIPLIREVAKTGKPMILSTGMSDITDISDALEAVLSGGNSKIALLHCVSTYPCSPSNANLPLIKKLSETFNITTGFSDHTSGYDVTLASIPLGAKIIEKHFTLDKKMDGPDHNFSLEVNELTRLVSGVKRIEESLYDHGFGVLACEIDTAQNLRRSIFLSKNIKKGQKIDKNNLVIKSPGIGIHPKYFDMILGKKLLKNLQKDEPVTWNDINI